MMTKERRIYLAKKLADDELTADEAYELKLAVNALWRELYSGRKVMGKHQLRLLRFVIDFPGWHSYSTDTNTMRALASLDQMGLIERERETRQFRLRQARAIQHEEAQHHGARS